MEMTKMEVEYMKKLNLINASGDNKIGIIKKLSLDDLDKLIALQKEIILGLKDKQEYADTEREVFEDYLKGKATILGCFVESELIAMGVYVSLGIDEDNYGYDLGIEGEQLLKVCQIESTVVKKNYRGNGLQKIICNELENIGIRDGMNIISATVYPENKYSLNTFLNLGYQVKREKIKYGGYRRYILEKKLR